MPNEYLDIGLDLGTPDECPYVDIIFTDLNGITAHWRLRRLPRLVFNAESPTTAKNTVIDGLKLTWSATRDELLPPQAAGYQDVRMAGSGASSGELTHFRTEPLAERQRVQRHAGSKIAWAT